jgi:tetratricopeptide (TPR) repeat protein
MKFSAKILSMLIAGLLLVLPVYAQTGQGIIVGKVTGRDGMPAANMQLQIQRMNSQNANQRIVAQVFDAKTGKNGSYSVNGLPPGSYQVLLFENGRQLMILGDKIGDYITVADGRESTASFDMRKGPEPIPAAAANGTAAPAISAADKEKERAAIEKAEKNKQTIKKAFDTGLAAYKGHDYDEAIKQFSTVTELDPKQDVAWANLGNSYKEAKKYEESASAYQKAIELKPKEAAYQNNLGLAYGGLKKMDDAKAAFEKAAELDPMKAGDYLFNEGAMYNNNQDYPKAIEAFKKTLASDPNNKAAMFQIAISYFATPDTMAEAEPILKKFLTLNPTPQDAEMAKQFLEAIHTTAPTEFKSEAAIAAEKKKADADAAAAAKASKAPKQAPAGKATK